MYVHCMLAVVCIYPTHVDSHRSDSAQGRSHDANGVPREGVAIEGRRRARRRYRRRHTPTAQLVEEIRNLGQRLSARTAVDLAGTTPLQPSAARAPTSVADISVNTDPLVIRVHQRDQPLYFTVTPMEFAILNGASSNNMPTYLVLEPAREFVDLDFTMFNDDWT